MLQAPVQDGKWWSVLAHGLAVGSEDDMDAYLQIWGDYLRRQLLVYRNWPQRAFDASGYKSGHVFADQNA